MRIIMFIIMKNIYYALSSLLILSCSQANKEEANFRAKQSENKPQVQGDTVPHLENSIMLVFQDSKGAYWFSGGGTGVYKYDGQHLINYNTKHGLASNRVDDIKEDSLGMLYFTSCHPHTAITKFDGKSFTELKAVPSTAWRLDPNDLWFRPAFGTEKIYRYDGSQLHELNLPKPKNLTNKFEIYCIYKDRKGNIWFGSNPSGVCRYNGKNFDWITEEDVTEFRNEGANGVRSILEDKNGDFWFNTEFRYSIYDSTTLNSDSFYTRHKSIGGLDGKADSNLDEYLSSLRDTAGNLWFVTYLDGVWMYDGQNIHHFGVQDEGKNISLFSIYLDKEGTLWLGSHENGCYRFNGKNFERFRI
jgi:ligand-binding sensor domain-containing protein